MNSVMTIPHQMDMYGGLVRQETPKEVRIKTSRVTTLRAIEDLTERGIPASRQMIVEHTGLKLSLVTDHIKDLKTDGKIRTLTPGVYSPIDITPDRAVSWTYMEVGKARLEIGDCCIDMNYLEEALVRGNGLMIRSTGASLELDANRWVCWTNMPNGRIKLEVGDDCVEVSHREALWIKGR